MSTAEAPTRAPRDTYLYAGDFDPRSPRTVRLEESAYVLDGHLIATYDAEDYMVEQGFSEKDAREYLLSLAR